MADAATATDEDEDAEWRRAYGDRSLLTPGDWSGLAKTVGGQWANKTAGAEASSISPPLAAVRAAEEKEKVNGAANGAAASTQEGVRAASPKSSEEQSGAVA